MTGAHRSQNASRKLVPSLSINELCSGFLTTADTTTKQPNIIIKNNYSNVSRTTNIYNYHKKIYISILLFCVSQCCYDRDALTVKKTEES